MQILLTLKPTCWTCETVFERNGKNQFWYITNSGEILYELKSKGILASSVSTYDFSTLYTILHHYLIKEKLTEIIEQTCNREGPLYFACYEKGTFFTHEQPKIFKLFHVRKFMTPSIIF